MRTITRTLTAAALAGAAILAGTWAAVAAPTNDPLPPQEGVTKLAPGSHGIVISPLGDTGVVCYERLAGKIPNTCFQRGSDGSWHELLGDTNHLLVFPVWEDPKAMLNVLPSQIRDQAETLLDR